MGAITSERLANVWTLIKASLRSLISGGVQAKTHEKTETVFPGDYPSIPRAIYLKSYLHKASTKPLMPIISSVSIVTANDVGADIWDEEKSWEVAYGPGVRDQTSQPHRLSNNHNPSWNKAPLAWQQGSRSFLLETFQTSPSSVTISRTAPLEEPKYRDESWLSKFFCDRGTGQSKPMLPIRSWYHHVFS